MYNKTTLTKPLRCLCQADQSPKRSRNNTSKVQTEAGAGGIMCRYAKRREMSQNVAERCHDGKDGKDAISQFASSSGCTSSSRSR